MIAKVCKKLLFGAVLSAAFGVGYSSASETITISGDPCTIPLAKKLGERFTSKTGIEVKYVQGGCRSGVKEVDGGSADIGVSTFNFDRLPDGLNKNVIGKAPIVMIVNRANPVNNISRQHLEGIMSGKIKNWKEVGGNDAPIKNVLLQPCVTETMASQLIAYGKDILRLTPEVKGNPVTGTNVLVEKDESAIGMQLYGYQSADVKVLKIADQLPGAKAFPEKYEFYEDYNVITKGEAGDKAKKFVEFALSAEGQTILAEFQHIPLKK